MSPVLEANALTYAYHGQLAPSVRLIPHLYKGTLEGTVWLDGTRTDKAPLWQLADKAGLVLHLPLRLPGHSGVFWMAILVVAHGLVPKPGALSLVGVTSGVLAAFMGLGDLGPIYTFFSYLASGVAVDLMALFLGGMDNVVVAGLTGLVGNVAKMLVKTLMAVLLQIPAGFVAFGLLYSFITNSIAGLAGGVVGWLILRALRRAGFFAYLAEKR